MTIVDVRAPERFRGESEPLDPAAGHIPGAVNRPWKALLDDAGRLVRAPEIDDRARAGTLVLSCGSGVTACVGLLALAAHGDALDARLFPGSWSGWVAAGGDVATGA